MSNFYNSKSFNNQSTLNVDNISTTAINNVVYTTNVIDVSNNIYILYSSVGSQNIYLNSLSGSIFNFNSTVGNTNNYLNSLSGSIKTINTTLVNTNNYLNSLSGSIKTINSGTFNSINATSLSANNVYCSNYGSQGGNLFINSPFGVYLSTANNCDTVFSSNRYFFQTQTGGNIECAINWGSTAQSGSYSMTVNGCIYAWGATMGSDDRIKGNESLLTNSTATLMKLRPQIYNKYNNFDCSGSSFIRESGLIAQEIYYDCPELQHIVSYSKDATISGYIASSTDPSIDPDYSCWGSSPAGVSYTQLIPYLIRGFQEQQTLIESLKNRIETLENP